MMNLKRLGIIAVLLLCGCSKSGLNLAPLSGTVTYNEENLTHGKVVLIPTGNTKGPPGIGQIKPDGTYAITTSQKPGAIVGTHKVTVVCRRKPTEQEKLSLAIPPLLIPKQYADGTITPLTVNIEPGGNTFDITLLP